MVAKKEGKKTTFKCGKKYENKIEKKDNKDKKHKELKDGRKE